MAAKKDEVTALWLGLLLGSLLFLASQASAQVKAFPTAEGFGSNSVGGRAGRVMHVTNLNDAGRGSLRDCMENTGPRTCIFTTGGTIHLSSHILVSGSSMSYLTVPGQTAPGGGIQITGYGIWLTHDVHDVIIRHIRLRSGHEANPSLYQEGFNLLVYAGSSDPGQAPHDIIIDHVSMQWGTYVQHEYSGARNVTTQWSFISTGENGYDYVDPQGNPALSMGAALGGYEDEDATITFHHNLLTSNEVRNPLIGQGQTIDYVNNISFNWYGCDYGFRVHDAGNPGWYVNINLTNNRIIPGPASGCQGAIMGSMGGGPYPSVYLSASASLASMGFVDQGNGSPLSESLRMSTPFNAPAVTVTPVDALEALLVSMVGATKPSRDALDTFYLNQFSSRQGGGGGRCSRCGQAYPTLDAGTAPTDSDGDGMPDSWEVAHGLNANSPGDGPQTASNGYTNLENYLNALAEDGTGTMNPPAAGKLPSPRNFRMVRK